MHAACIHARMLADAHAQARAYAHFEHDSFSCDNVHVEMIQDVEHVADHGLQHLLDDLMDRPREHRSNLRADAPDFIPANKAPSSHELVLECSNIIRELSQQCSKMTAVLHDCRGAHKIEAYTYDDLELHWLTFRTEIEEALRDTAHETVNDVLKAFSSASAGSSTGSVDDLSLGAPGLRYTQQELVALLGDDLEIRKHVPHESRVLNDFAKEVPPTGSALSFGASDVPYTQQELVALLGDDRTLRKNVPCPNTVHHSLQASCSASKPDKFTDCVFDHTEIIPDQRFVVKRPLHLGLCLEVGRTYNLQELEHCCAGDTVKLAQLHSYLEDAAFLENSCAQNLEVGAHHGVEIDFVEVIRLPPTNCPIICIRNVKAKGEQSIFSSAKWLEQSFAQAIMSNQT